MHQKNSTRAKSFAESLLFENLNYVQVINNKCCFISGLKPSDEEVIGMIDSVDIDDNGVLSLCEFIRLMSKQHKPFVTPKAQFEAVFRAFDSDGNGQLSREEFKKSLFSVGQRCSEDEFENLMSELDRNMDGRISKKEFLSVFLTQGHGNTTC